MCESVFTQALRAAIRTRGASLESLRVALLERGSRVSVATLSYWRSGRSRPDRGGSMIALAHLEEVLGLPPGFLTSKVNPRGPGSAVASELPTHYVMAEVPTTGPGNGSDAAVVRAGLAMLGIDTDDGLDRVSYHDRLEVRPDRTDGAHDVRTVFVARRAGVDRFSIWYSHSDDKAFPFVMALTNCRLGQVIEFREKSAVAAEMVLDHSLDAGESVIVEHRVESIGQTEAVHDLMRRVTTPIRELVMEVRFPTEQIPQLAVMRTMVGGKPVVRPTSLVGNALHLLVMDPEPGVYGLQWTWPDETSAGDAAERDDGAGTIESAAAFGAPTVSGETTGETTGEIRTAHPRRPAEEADD